MVFFLLVLMFLLSLHYWLFIDATLLALVALLLVYCTLCITCPVQGHSTHTHRHTHASDLMQYLSDEQYQSSSVIHYIDVMLLMYDDCSYLLC